MLGRTQPQISRARAGIPHLSKQEPPSSWFRVSKQYISRLHAHTRKRCHMTYHTSCHLREPLLLNLIPACCSSALQAVRMRAHAACPAGPCTPMTHAYPATLTKNPGFPIPEGRAFLTIVPDWCRFAPMTPSWVLASEIVQTKSTSGERRN